MAAIDELVRETVRLVPPPELIVRISAAVDDPDASAESVAAVVKHDPALTGQLLRMANCALFGGRQSVETVERAITLVGTTVVGGLALSLAFSRQLKRYGPRTFSHRIFWHHSVATAVCAQAVAQAAGLRRTEAAFVAGLLHDIGWPVLEAVASQRRESAGVAASPARQGRLSYLEERQAFGFDHGAVGAALARHWHLTPRIIASIEWHHEPHRASEDAVEAHIVHIAEHLAAHLDATAGSVGAEGSLVPAALSVVGVTPEQVISLVPIIRERMSQVRALFGTTFK